MRWTALWASGVVGSVKLASTVRAWALGRLICDLVVDLFDELDDILIHGFRRCTRDEIFSTKEQPALDEIGKHESR